MIIPTFLDILERSILYIKSFTNIIIKIHYNASYNIIKKHIPDFLPERILIVGGGILPRSVIIFQAFYPLAKLYVLDMNEHSLELAQRYINNYNKYNISFIHSKYDPCLSKDYDLVIFPLAFRGLNAKAYTTSIRHCWIWEKHPNSEIVSIFLLKKIVIDL